ncbi:hypothetical protein [Petrachloros mirabilis]
MGAGVECLSGRNGTIIGAGANAVVDLAKLAGYQISFSQLFAVGFPVMIGSIFISMLYLWGIYLA